MAVLRFHLLNNSGIVCDAAPGSQSLAYRLRLLLSINGLIAGFDLSRRSGGNHWNCFNINHCCISQGVADCRIVGNVRPTHMAALHGGTVGQAT
jgi:hypothetical protein